MFPMCKLQIITNAGHSGQLSQNWGYSPWNLLGLPSLGLHQKKHSVLIIHVITLEVTQPVPNL